MYNSDFVERNFTSTLKGIFTLGEVSAETLEKIKTAKEKQREHEEAISKLGGTLRGPDGKTGKVGDLDKLRHTFEETCWDIKNRHDPHFRDVFEGFRNAKARFCDKVLAEQVSNKTVPCELDDLKSRAKSVFQKGLTRLATLVVPAFENLIQLEQSAILAKKVVGKEDVNVSALIRRLGNSDWVKQGRGYLEQSGDVCPFCQQQLLTDVARDFNDYLALRVFWWKQRLSNQSSGSPRVRILRARYSSSRRPKARRWMTRILLLKPSTKPMATLFSGLQ